MLIQEMLQAAPLVHERTIHQVACPQRASQGRCLLIVPSIVVGPSSTRNFMECHSSTVAAHSLSSRTRCRGLRLQRIDLAITSLGPVIFRDRGKLAEFAELPT